MTIQEIKEIVSVEQILTSFYGLEVKKRMDCPIHGGDKCFSFKEGFYICYSCGAKGDIFSLVQEISKVSFQDAKKRICEHFNIPSSFNCSYSEAEKQAYKARLERRQKEQNERLILQKLRRYQQYRICQTLREIRTEEGDSFLEKHLESLLARFDKRKEFFITHDIHAHLRALLLRHISNSKNIAD